MSKTGSEVFETRLGWVGLINGETGLQCLHLKPKLEDIIQWSNSKSENIYFYLKSCKSHLNQASSFLVQVSKNH